MKRKTKKVEAKQVFSDKEIFAEVVRLSIREVTRLTGATKRQVRYWADQNYISYRNDDPYEFGFYDVRKVYLIARYLDKGLSLKKAREKAEQVLNNSDNREIKELQISRQGKKITEEEVREKAEKIAQKTVLKSIKDPEFLKKLSEEVYKRVRKEESKANIGSG